MTKGAISNLTLTLAQQLGKRGITVNSLAPGVTDTEINAARLNEAAKRYLGGQTALGRWARQKIWLESRRSSLLEDSRWVTAQCIEASGGLRL